MKNSVIRISAILFSATVLFNACENDRSVSTASPTNGQAEAHVQPAIQGKPVTLELNVASIRTASEGNTVLFCQNPQILTVRDASVLSTLQTAYQLHQKVKVTFHPWTASVNSAELLIGTQPTPAKIEGKAINLNSVNT